MGYSSFISRGGRAVNPDLVEMLREIKPGQMV